MNNAKQTYHIIGAGIAGLATAKFLKDRKPECSVIVYEASSKLGGKCYTYFDRKMGREIDNAVHVILGANKTVRKLVRKQKFHNNILYFNSWTKQLSYKSSRFCDHITASLFNTPEHLLGNACKLKVLKLLFPFTKRRLKSAFSQSSLSRDLVHPLSFSADSINYNHKLLGFQAEGDRITALQFNDKIVKLGENDTIISALDAKNYTKIFEPNKDFEYSDIINIHYLTSMPLTLPNKVKMLGVPGGLAHWFFIDRNVVSATISCAENIKMPKDEIAREVWKELCTIRGSQAAFLPEYRFLYFRRATLKLNDKNNRQRPQSALTLYKNFFICGDWTMKDYPCCLEAAALSAQRIIKTLRAQQFQHFFDKVLSAFAHIFD